MPCPWASGHIWPSIGVFGFLTCLLSGLPKYNLAYLVGCKRVVARLEEDHEGVVATLTRNEGLWAVVSQKPSFAWARDSGQVGLHGAANKTRHHRPPARVIALISYSLTRHRSRVLALSLFVCVCHLHHRWGFHKEACRKSLSLRACASR